MWLKPFKGGSHQGKNLLSIYSSYSTNSLKYSSDYWYFSALKYFYPLIWSLKKQKIDIKQSYLKTTRATTKTTDRFLYHLFQPERGITKTTHLSLVAISRRFQWSHGTWKNELRKYRIMRWRIKAIDVIVHYLTGRGDQRASSVKNPVNV